MSQRDPLIVHVGKSDSLYSTMLCQLQLIQAAGYRVLALTASDKWGRLLQANAIPVEHLPFSTTVAPDAMASSFYRLRSLLTKLKPDIIHTHNPIPSAITRLAVRRFSPGIPVINTVHGWVFYDDQPPLQQALFGRIERYLAGLTTLTLFQSADDLDFAVANRIVPGNQTRYLGNGIEIESFRRRYRSADVSALRRSLSIPEDKTVITLVSRLVPIKDPALFIESVARLRQRGVDFVALIAGDGKNHPQYEKLAADLGVEKDVRFLGQRDDIPELLSITDILALTSRKEGIPRTVMEAMAVGVPVVATNVRGTREIVRDGETGRLAAQSPDDVARALAELIHCPQQARVLAAAAMSYANQHFCQHAVTRRVLAVYESLLKESRYEYRFTRN